MLQKPSFGYNCHSRLLYNEIDFCNPQKIYVDQFCPQSFLSCAVRARAINTLTSGGLRQKSSSLHMFLCRNVSADDCAKELFKPWKDLASLRICNAKFVLFCKWHHKWSCFRSFWSTSSDPRPKPLDDSISLKFLLETRLKSESFDILGDLLGFRGFKSYDLKTTKLLQ